MRKTWINALLALIVPAAGFGAQAYRSERMDKLYQCEVPEGWTERALEAPEKGAAYSSGLLRIKAARHAGKTPEAYLAGLSRKPKKAGSVKVAGKTADLWTLRYETRPRGAAREYVYEELVLLPDKQGFWELKFTSASRMYRETPRGLEAWKRFLASFKPEIQP
ncbi:MAG TPA: hypothetical protein DCM05_02975 [Elusimicrobia bacterium]|nr:hypothetical protein [Elusimicrobiota bacterium]